MKQKVDMKQFLGRSGFSVVDGRSKRKPMISFGGAFLGMLSLALIFGLLLAVFPTMGLSAGTLAAEPAVQVWKGIDDTMPEVAIAQRNVLYDKNGAPFAELWVEDRTEVNSLDAISAFAKQGLIDTEDKRFYQNPGFDFKGTLRSAVSGSGGGSGITQQLVKNLQFYNILGRGSKGAATERTLARKAKELKIAMRFEKEHSKDQILLMYFNTVAFGAPTIYGIETASKYFFGKSAKDLTLAEAAALVGSAQNPALYNLNKSEDTWKPRQLAVLGRLLAEGHITQEQYDQAKVEKLNMVFQKSTNGNCYSSKYPMYCKYVYDTLMRSPRLGATSTEREAILSKGGLQIKTYLDPVAMQKAEDDLKKGFGTTNRIVAPTAIVQPGTGGVLAIAQNRDWGDGPGKTTLNTPDIAAGEGSVYKIFTLATALNAGMKEKDLDFASLGCPLNPGSGYAAPPGGFKNSSSCELQGGKLDYKHATAYSSNTWYVTLEMKVTVEKVKEFSASVGLAAPDGINNSSLSYTLGSVENTPVDMAAALATFSNKGVYCPATPIVAFAYADGTQPAIPDNYDPTVDACRAVMSPQNAGIVLKAMRANVSGEIPNAFGVKAKIDGYDTVGKSGTNQELNSTWTQLSSQYALFTDVYDMDTPTNGIDGVMYNGTLHDWHNNTAQEAGNQIMRDILQGQPNVPLDYDDPNTTISKTTVNQSAFFVMPSVMGMEPGQAVAALEAQGLTVNVSKTYKPLPKGYQAGVIVEQSVPAGEKLAKGTKREVTLYIGR